MSRKLPNASEMGKVGGKKRFEEIGSEGMRELGEKGKETLKKKDPDFYKRFSQLGVQARKAKKEAEVKKKRSPVQKVADLLNGK